MLIRLAIPTAWVFIAWRWGDWRHWQDYQSTFLFWIAVNLLQEVLTYNYTLWKFEPTGLFFNHTTMVLAMFVNYVCITLVYLPHFPTRSLGRKIGWVGLWAAIFAVIEFATVRMHYISYHHGWSYLCSVALDIIMFSLLRLHHTRPGVAYALTAVAAVSGLLLFHVPVSSIK